jgi:recombinational DNA repair protein RecR
MGIAADAVRRRIKATPQQMAKGVVQAAAQAIEGGFVDPAERLQTCRSCEHFLKSERCALCGCFMPAKARVKLATCPDGRW